MSLFKRGTVWWINFTAPDGNRIRHSAGTEDRDKAQEYHDRLNTRLWDQHRLGVKPQRSWEEAVVRWLREKEHKRSLDDDKAKLRWLDRHLRNTMLNHITRDLIDKIGEAKKAESTPATANRHLALIRSILRAARDDWEWIDHVPKVRLFHEPRKRVHWITNDEAFRLLEALPPHLADMAQFTLATGLRQANVSYLRWNQVDMRRAVAWIHADQTKAQRAISVPLNGDALDVLHRRHADHPEFVFTYQGKPVDRCSTKAWKRALAVAGIENFRWHDLRHTWASWHVQNGTSLQELMELGSWSTYEMVMRYAHLASDHLKGAAGRIDGTFTAQSPKVHRLRVA